METTTAAGKVMNSLTLPAQLAGLPSEEARPRWR
jgi:hypothetical protein